jgi:hypothetical protein
MGAPAEPVGATGATDGVQTLCTDGGAMTTDERTTGDASAGEAAEHDGSGRLATLVERMKASHPFRVRSGQDPDPRHYHLRGPVGFPHESRDFGHH